MAVVVSARGDRLSSAPPGWVRALAHGAWWLRAAVMLALPIVYLGVALSSYAVWVLTIAQPGRAEPSLDRSYRLAARWLTAIGSLIVSAMALGGLIVVTATDHRFMGDWNMRLSYGLGTVLGGGSAPGRGGGPMDNLPAFDALFLLGHAVYVLGLLACWRYLGILAQRVPDNTLASAWRGLGRGWLASVLGLAGASGGANLLVGTGIVPGGSATFWVPMVLGVMFLGVLVSLWVATLRVTGRQVAVLGGEAGKQKSRKTGKQKSRK